jgi:hypothetical protein
MSESNIAMSRKTQECKLQQGILYRRPSRWKVNIKMIVKQWDMSIRAGYFWFRIGSTVQARNGPSASIKGKKCFGQFSDLRIATVNSSLVNAISETEQQSEGS